MTEYICKEVQTDNGGYLEPVNELIRCKDCKWYDEGYNEEESWTWCKSNEMSVDEDFFCKDGERKEEW